MSSTTPNIPRSDNWLYFAFIGASVAVLLAGVHASDAAPGASPSDLYLVKEYVQIGLLAIGYVGFSTFGDSLRARFNVPVWLYDSVIVLWCATLAWTCWHLVSTEHNRFIIVIAIVQATALRALLRMSAWLDVVALYCIAILSWSMSVTIPFTPLKDWLADASPGTSLAALAFTVSFFVVLIALANNGVEIRLGGARRLASYGLAGAVFVEASLRTDHLLSDWIPYHRAYFADVADFVRSGHWLLWDVPSQYGFLSTLAIAVTPGQNGWQSLYLLTAVLLVVEALITFTILYYGQRNVASYALAILLPLATYFCSGITRYPFDGRLYPQGGVRFIWTVLLIFVAFCMYVRRRDRRAVRLLRVAGYGTWAMSVLWSFETGVWGTIVWLATTCTEAAVESFAGGRFSSKRSLRIFASRLAPFPAILLIIFGTVELIYRIALGHGPDLVSYLEFTAVYAADPAFHDVVDRSGPAWTLVLILGALGAIGIVAARARKLDGLPLIATAWMATWATTSYWVGESFNSHVVAVYAVAIPSAAVAVFLSREVLRESGAATLARLSLAPIAIVMIALLFGEPNRMSSIKAPFVPGWTFDSTRGFPAISGELLELVDRAHIKPTDRVVFPTSVGWVKLDYGFILPFAREKDGSVTEYQSWLPLGPEGIYNSFESLPLDRRQLYINRVLDNFRGSAWYITYREAGGCSLISSRLVPVRSVNSSNFRASLCEVGPYHAATAP